MDFKQSVVAIINELSGTVYVEEDAWGACLVQCPEIPPLLLMPTRGGRMEATAHFPDHPESLVVWEDHFFHKPEIIRSRIASRFGVTERIHARQCRIEVIDKPTLHAFLETHHMHVPAGAKTKLGLYRKEELVAVASFSKPCPIHRDGRVWKSVELIRFCNASGSTVVGGLSKLLKYYIRRYAPEDIMTYADLEWSSGESYRRLEFREIGKREPQQFWIQPGTLRRFYPHQEDDLLATLGAASLDESALLEKGWTLAKNRGSLKFVLECK